VTGLRAVDGAIRCAPVLAETLAQRVGAYAIEARDLRAPLERRVDRVTGRVHPSGDAHRRWQLLPVGSEGQWESGIIWRRSRRWSSPAPAPWGLPHQWQRPSSDAGAIGRGRRCDVAQRTGSAPRGWGRGFDKTATLEHRPPHELDISLSRRRSTSPDESVLLAAEWSGRCATLFPGRCRIHARAWWSVPAAPGVSGTAGRRDHGFYVWRGMETSAVGKRSWWRHGGRQWPPNPRPRRRRHRSNRD